MDDKRIISQIRRLWNVGADSAAIAAIVQAPEHYVARKISEYVTQRAEARRRQASAKETA
jgi:hypothetical protein